MATGRGVVQQSRRLVLPRSTPWGTLPDGTTFDGPVEMRQALLSRSDNFVATLTEKLLTYALGRGAEHYDMPAVRAIHARRGSQRPPLFVARVGRSSTAFPFQNEEIGVMIITKTALPRRTFLRGMGATLALPLLDAMVPAMSAMSQTAARPVHRPWLSLFAERRGDESHGYQPLESRSARGASFRILADSAPARALPGPAGRGQRAQPRAGGVDGRRPRRSHARHRDLAERGAPEVHSGWPTCAWGVTVDQVAAAALGQDTVLPSLELSVDRNFLMRQLRQWLQLRLHETRCRGQDADDTAAH